MKPRNAHLPDAAQTLAGFAPLRRLVWAVVCLLALCAPLLPAQAGSLPLMGGCPGGRFVATVESVQRKNWFESSPTVYEQKEVYFRLPAWLGRLTVVHASQGFLLSGEERLGEWTQVTVPPSLTVTMRVFGKSYYWPLLLPVVRDTMACRDERGDLFVR